MKCSDNIHCPGYETLGSDNKGETVPDWNSDFPVVSSLSSITSSPVMNSRPLVTLDQQGGKKDEVMEKNKKFFKKSQEKCTMYWKAN